MQPKANVRRVSVKQHRGIHYRIDADGRRRYEITFYDSEGKRRWKTIGSNLKEAEAALEDIRAKKRRGERIAPSRATLAEAAEVWLATQSQLRPRTRESYEQSFRNHVLPRLGRLRLAEITQDDVALLIAEMQAAGYAAWTILTVLKPLGKLLGHAVRRGQIGSNPVRGLETDERPSPGTREMRILQRDEIHALLEAADPRYRSLLATAVFTGLRIGELLGLTWADVDFKDGTLHVRMQLDRDGCRVEPKTPDAKRSVVLMPALGRLLRVHQLASPHSSAGDLVFASSLGTGFDRRNVSRRGLARAVQAAGLDGADRPRLRFHDLRHTFASLLIAQGTNVVFVSRQLGHKTPAVTLGVYAHLFDHAEHAERASAELETSFAGVLNL